MCFGDQTKLNLKVFAHSVGERRYCHPVRHMFPALPSCFTCALTIKCICIALQKILLPCVANVYIRDACMWHNIQIGPANLVYGLWKGKTNVNGCLRK